MLIPSTIYSQMHLNQEGDPYILIIYYCASNRVTRISQNGILLYLNSSPIIFYSKRENNVESSTFGSEFVALRIAPELIILMRYNLPMFGIKIDGPDNVFFSKEDVYINSTFAKSKLRRKYQSIFSIGSVSVLKQVVP